MKKINKSDLGINFEGMSTEQREFMEKNASMIVDIVNKALEGELDSEQVTKQFKDVTTELDKFKNIDAEKLQQVLKDNEELCATVKELSENMEKAKKAGYTIGQVNQFAENFEKMMESRKMQDFIGGTEKSVSFEGFRLKDITAITSMENNYSGDVLTAYQSQFMASPFTFNKTHVRDIITSINADPKFPSFTYLRVAEFDRNARYVTENGRLSQSSLKLEEVSTSIRRVGTYFDLSKNLLMARVQLRSWIVATIPGIITTAEDAAVLFGDGTKNQLLGITNINGVEPIEKQITGAIIEGKAGEVAKIESYNNGKDVLVEFTKPLSLALDSMMITFEGAAVITDLNKATPIVKLNDRQFILRGVEYKGEETNLANLTFKVNHASFKSIDVPNSKDVIRTIVACLTFAQYTPNAIVLNPLTLNAMEGEKDSIGRDLELVQIIGGRKYIAGIPVIELPVMPVGYYLAGDFNQGAQLYDYSKLDIQWKEDAETALYNMVRLITQEQLGLVVYMPWAFAYGKLEDLKTAITKD